MPLYRTTKKVLSVSPGAVRFLNGLAANTPESPRSAFLDIHGKIVATFDQKTVSDDLVLIAVEERTVRPLLDHLERYARLSRVTVAPAGLNAYFDLNGDHRPEVGEHSIPQRQGQLILSGRELAAPVGEEEFTLFRLRHGIALNGVDYTDEMILNVGEDEFVSYTKGCFLGQEFVAKVHNRSKPTWKLTVIAEGEAPPDVRQPPTSKMRDPKSGRVLGFAFVRNT